MQRNALCSSELLCDVVERAASRLRQANPSEGEGEQRNGHEEQVDVRATHFLFEGETDRDIKKIKYRYLTFCLTKKSLKNLNLCYPENCWRVDEGKEEKRRNARISGRFQFSAAQTDVSLFNC